MDASVPIEHVLLRIKVLNLAYLTVALPLFTLLFCFATSMLFQYTAVNTTVCKVSLITFHARNDACSALVTRLIFAASRYGSALSFVSCVTLKALSPNVTTFIADEVFFAT
ncbi:hypothetical protein HPB51_007693 [Rhipicephalus microplus]|uniref:Uncharacterized protein n=1 Tax=Rhipicephalus microplus TaxID=6941 RepID=A0A9J6DT79_RHIMP|nr:hypothetical protein HPB51_007693 [Rhipicephalus microplus]